MRRMLTAELAAGLAAAALALPGAACAQAYPSKPVTIVLSYAAGGPTDFLARTLGEKVSARIAQPVLVDPKPGANERVATEYLLRQPADGYTTVLVALPHATNPAVFASLPYDTVKEFIGLIHLVNIPVILTVKSDSPIRNFADFAAFAKAKPGEAMFGSPGAATSSHLTVELLGTLTGATFTHIPYKGDAPAMTELMGGRIVASVNSLPGALGQIRGGRVRSIGISSAQRVPILPDVPTFAEEGLIGFEILNWYGVMAPAATPKDIVNKLAADINKAMREPEVKARLEQVGTQLRELSPDEFGAFMRAELAKYTKLVKDANIRLE